MNIKIIGHRGYRQKYPENTLLSFRKALECGADGIEMDIHATSDGKLVVHHDYYLGASDSGKGIIFTLPFSYIRQLDAGSWFNPQYSSEHIPQLEEVFSEFGKSTHYELELKGFTGEFVTAVLEMVNKFKLIDQIEFTSPHQSILYELRKRKQHAQIGLFVEEYPVWMTPDIGEKLVCEYMHLSSFRVAHCQVSLLNKTFVQKLHDAGIKVHAADCNSIKAISLAFTLGVDQLSTDMVEMAVAQNEQYEQRN